MFTMTVPAVAFTTAAIWSVALELALMSPIVQTPVEDAYVPRDAVAFRKPSPEGKVSVAMTPVEVAGPKALTATV
jgi:hypothetical protein